MKKIYLKNEINQAVEALLDLITEEAEEYKGRFNMIKEAEEERSLQDLLEELEEQMELAKTKASLLAKQEERLKATLQEQETKIQEMMKNPSTNTKPSK